MPGPWEEYQRRAEERPRGVHGPWSAYGGGGDGRMGAAAAFGSGAADAITFGFGDELQGVLFGDRARDAARMRQEQARADQGGWFLGGQLAGSLAGGGGAGVAARGALGAARLANAASRIGPMGRIGLGALAGGVGGAAYGAGDSPDGDRVRNAVNSFLPGAAFGAVGQGAGELIGRVGGAVQRSLSPEARSGRMMAEALGRFGPESATPAQAEAQVLQALRDAPAQAEAQVLQALRDAPAQAEAQVLQALRDAPDNAMVADVVPGFTSLVRGAGVRPSVAREELRAAFDVRNDAMGDRAIDDIWETLAPGAPRNAAQAIDNLAKVQRDNAKPLYDAVMNARIDPARAERFLGETVRRNPRLFAAAERDAEELMLSEHGVRFGRDDPRFWHYLQQGADQVFERLRRQQGGLSGNERRVFGRALDSYRLGLRRLLGPDFGKAQDVWSSGARQRQAVELGFDAADDKLDDLKLGEIMQQMRRMSGGEREMTRLGAVARLTNMLRTADAGTGRSDTLRAILRNKGQRQVLETIFGGGDRFNALMRRLDTQRDLFRTSVDAGIGVNSHTADRLAAMNSQQALTQPATGVRDAIFRMLTRDATDRFDENVSNEILRTAGMNANQVAGEVGQVGGFADWAGGRGLLSRAVRERQRMLRQRPEALLGAFGTGLYAPTAGAGVGAWGTGG